jgi:DNA polymerase-4
VGIAANKFLAKLASEEAKPDGVHRIPAGDELAFLHPLDVRALWGVGEATRAALERLGVTTVGELAALPEELLRRHLGAANGAHLHELAHGRDSRTVTPDVEAKSLSVEQTYESDLVGREVVETEVLRHSDRLSWRLRRSGLVGRTLTVKVRFPDFSTVTRSCTLEAPTDHVREVNAVAQRLVMQVVDGRRPVRLLGVGMSGLAAAGGPRQLAVDRPAKWDDLADAVDGIRVKFGREAVGPARLATGGAATPEGTDDGAKRSAAPW